MEKSFLPFQPVFVNFDFEVATVEEVCVPIRDLIGLIGLEEGKVDFHHFEDSILASHFQILSIRSKRARKSVFDFFFEVGRFGYPSSGDVSTKINLVFLSILLDWRKT